MSPLHSTKFTFFLPFLQVNRRIDFHVLAYRKNHNPVLSGCIPKYLWVTKILFRRSQDRVTFIFRKSFSVIQAIGHTLHLYISPWSRFSRSIECHHSFFTKTSRIFMVDHTGTTKNSPPCIWYDGTPFKFPMHQIGTGRMSPMHIAPNRPIRIILEIQMIYPIFIKHSVRVVHPAVSRSMVINRTEFLLVRHVK